MDPQSPHLESVIRDMTNPKKLFTPYGLRSLSKSSSLYLARNTEHDPPYWRGPIWININYLAVRALKHYSTVEGPNQKLASEAYVKLRKAVVENVVKEYKRTGYVWEQYNDKTGEGQGCRPFTGWSALVVLMMGEQYWVFSSLSLTRLSWIFNQEQWDGICVGVRQWQDWRGVRVLAVHGVVGPGCAFVGFIKLVINDKVLQDWGGVGEQAVA